MRQFKGKKKQRTPLINQLIAVLAEYKSIIESANVIEERTLDEDLRSTNMNMSIYDPLVVLDDLRMVYERRKERD